MGLLDRFKSAWNAFSNREPTISYREVGPGYSYRPDRTRYSRGHEKTLINSIINRIAMDAAAINIHHIRLDKNERFKEIIKSGLNTCLTLEANIDQTGRAFRQDMIMSMLDEGCVAVVPIDITVNPTKSDSYSIDSMRVGKILEWFPSHVRIQVYNDRKGYREDIMLPKHAVAIVENPLYAVMNEPNSTLQRLVRKLSLLDVVDEQSSSGKLDL